MTFFPHLVKLMTKREITAQVRFAAVPQPATDRKQLAKQLRTAVVQLSRGSAE